MLCCLWLGEQTIFLNCTEQNVCSHLIVWDFRQKSKSKALTLPPRKFLPYLDEINDIPNTSKPDTYTCRHRSAKIALIICDYFLFDRMFKQTVKFSTVPPETTRAFTSSDSAAAPPCWSSQDLPINPYKRTKTKSF